MDPVLLNIARALSQSVSETTQDAIETMPGENGGFGSLYIASAAALGAVQIMATLTGTPWNAESAKANPELVTQSINEDSMLFSLMLLRAMCSGAEPGGAKRRGEGTSVNLRISYSPEELWEAIQAFEKITGRPITEAKLDQRMIKAVKAGLESTVVPLEKFMRSRPQSGSLH